MVQPVRVIKITSDRLVSGEFRDEGMLALLTQWRGAPIKVEEQLLKRQTWQANVNSGLIRPITRPCLSPVSWNVYVRLCTNWGSYVLSQHGTVD